MITVNHLGQTESAWVGSRIIEPGRGLPTQIAPGAPPPPPAAELFLSQLADRYLGYALGRTRARAYRGETLAVKERILRDAPGRYYATYTSMKNRWLAVAQRGRIAEPRRIVTYAPPPPPRPVEHVTLVTPVPPSVPTRMPPAPPAAELFLSSLVNTYLQYAMGRTRARAYQHLSLAVKEETLSKASPRHYRSYVSKKNQWLAVARGAAPPPAAISPPVRVTPPPIPPVVREHIAPPPRIPTFAPPPPVSRPTEHVTLVTPAPPSVPTRMPPPPPPAERFLHSLLYRYLRAARGTAFATKMRPASLRAKEEYLRKVSNRRYKTYMRQKEDWLRVAARR